MAEEGEVAKDPPGLLILRGHLASAPFLSGVDAGCWRADAPIWPTLLVDLLATGGQVCLRFETSGYPEQPLTSSPWDRQTGAVLATDRWPTGPAASRVFHPGWSEKNNWALYFPLDRMAINGHNNWFTATPSLSWTRAKTICDYLDYVSGVLRGARFPGQ